MGSEDAKAGRTDDAIFGLYSLGLLTSRDAYIYNFSRNACVENAQQMTQDYLDALSDLKDNPKLTVDEAMSQYNSNIKWTGNLKDNLKQRKKQSLAMITSEELYTVHLLPRIVMPTISSYTESIKWIKFFQTVQAKTA